MDIGKQLEFVVDHLKVARVRWQTQILGFSGRLKRDPFFKLGGVYRMTESYSSYQLLKVRVLWILVEPAFGNMGFESRCIEFETVVL